jgi:hypothetical protein
MSDRYSSLSFWLTLCVFIRRDKLISELNPYAGGIVDKNRPDNLPLEPPTFTLTTLKNAIPAHCFKRYVKLNSSKFIHILTVPYRNLFMSLMHLTSDLSIIAVLGYLATWIGHSSLPIWSPYILWPLYWYTQGAVMTGVW